jgi:hypothetical protein
MLVLSQYHIFESYKTNIYRVGLQIWGFGSIRNIYGPRTLITGTVLYIPAVFSCSQIHSPCPGGYSPLWLKVVVPGRQATSAGGPVRQPYAGVNYIPQVRDYQFGY